MIARFVFASTLVLAGLLGGSGARSASDEDAYRRMLEGGAAKERPASGEKEAPRAAPKPKKVVRPAEPKVPCYQRFAALKADLDQRERYNSKWCFIEEKCTDRQQCEHSTKMIGEYTTMARLAASCPQMPDAVRLAKMYGDGIPAARSLANRYCNR